MTLNEWEQLELHLAEAPAKSDARSPVAPVLLTITAAGRMLGVGRTTAYKLVRSGDLDVVHIRRAARVPVAAVHDYVERLRRRTGPA